MERKDRLKRLIEELVSIPSVTESERESEPAFWIKERLEHLAYFSENPGRLRLIETPREGSARRLYALAARVDAPVPTKRTVLLISHFDVVDARAYGGLAACAFDSAELSSRFGADAEEEPVMYGRGVMDMKCGVALEVDLLEEFARDRGLFDVNLVAVFVGDEENSSAGMRGVLPLLSALQKEEGLGFLAAVNTEPGEAGRTGASGPMVYLGTLGKLLPAFYIRGKGAHVGNCYRGYSAALAASHLALAAEGEPSLADPLNGTAPPSWICLDLRVIKEGYSVTVPDRAYLYFNCFTATNSPASVLEQMKKLAFSALENTSGQYARSCAGLTAAGYEGEAFDAPPVKVFTFGELVSLARRKRGGDFDAELGEFMRTLPAGDMRERGISVVDKIAELSGEEEPYAVCFFLPPWLPVRTDFTGGERDREVIEAARGVSGLLRREYGLEMLEIELFAGLCDLSYVGGKVSEPDLAVLETNLPGFGEIYKLPLSDMRSLGLPVVNLGPSGEDAHKKGERLRLRYSLEILPELLRELIRQLSRRVGGGM